MDMHISQAQLTAFERHLRLEEREPATIEKYLRDIRSFAMWLEERVLCKEAVVAWKENLLAKHYAPSTVNSMLIAVNRFFRFQHWDELRVKTVRVQRQIFRRRDKELTKEEYARLLDAAQDLGRERLALLMETICATGSGEIFLTRTGKGMSRRQIWAEMKSICKKAGVAPSKVFPHNLRHLFARTFYKVCRDVVQLADVLGHSSVETTRIYLATTGDEYVRRMDRLGLIS